MAFLCLELASGTLGVCGNADHIYSMGMASRGPPKTHNRGRLHVHMPGHPRLLHPTSFASGNTHTIVMHRA